MMQTYAQDTRQGLRRLRWSTRAGVGYYPAEPAGVYDAAYWAKYERYAATDMGRELTRFRVDLVARHHDGPALDVGIGCGQFIEDRPETMGYDVNPVGVRWLRERYAYHDPRTDGPMPAGTFWDSLEHIRHPGRFLRALGARWLFLSIPIFRGPWHALRSRHYRPDEHFWYFTRRGLVRWLGRMGYDLREISHAETELGRHGIESFAFERPMG